MPEPKFKPKPRQVDFTRARWAPVINCAVRCRGKILMLRRSTNLRLYPGYWSGVSGFLDDQKSLEEKVFEELREEVGIPPERVRKIRRGQIFDQEAPRYKKTWIVHPVLVEVSTDKIRLDWEAGEYKWLKPEEVRKLNLLPGFKQVIKNLSAWL